MNHLEFAAYETAQIRPTKWSRWVDVVEGILGHNIDGTQSDDGYSIDDAYDAYREGQSPQAHARQIQPGETYARH